VKARARARVFMGIPLVLKGLRIEKKPMHFNPVL
jgi:hypothetical protein